MHPTIGPVTALIVASLLSAGEHLDVQFVLSDAYDAQFGPGELIIDACLRGGTWQAEARAYAPWIDQGDQDCRLAVRSAEESRCQLTAEITMASLWRQDLKPGSFTMDLDRRDAVWEGTWQGGFAGAQRSGKVLGTSRQPWPRAIPGFAPPVAGEHPRTILRKSEVESLRRRMADSPDGQALRERFLKQVAAFSKKDFLPVGAKTDSEEETAKRETWVAAGQAAAWLLTGEAGYAQHARVLLDEALAEPLPATAQDIHAAPRLLGMAWTYDLAYDAWEPAYRVTVLEAIRTQAIALLTNRLPGSDRASPA